MAEEKQYFKSAYTGEQIEAAIAAVINGDAGGGVNSWDDLTDKPFGENEAGAIKKLDNRFLAILNKTSETEVIAEQSLDFSYSIDNGNGVPLYVCSIDSKLIEPVEIGKDYVVTFSGKNYSFTAKHYDDRSLNAYFLGNFALLWAGIPEEDTGEDLLIIWTPNDAYAQIWTSQSGKTHSFKVSRATYVVKGEYLPAGSGGSGGYYTPVVTQSSDSTMQVGYTPSDLSMPEVPSVTVTLPEGPQGEQGPQGETGPKGETGEAGYTPVKGTDYWTEQDKQEIVESVKSELPESGGSGLPTVTTEDNDKILQVVNGEWKEIAIADSAVKTYIDDYINEALGGEY